MTHTPENRRLARRRTRRPRAVWLSTLILLGFAGQAQAQYAGESAFQQLTIRPVLGFEYFTRTITWDEESSVSDLTAYDLTLQVDFSIEGGFTLSAIGGLAFANFDGLTFRNLPLTLALDVGNIRGLFVGGALERSLFKIRAFEISARGQFVYFHGSSQEWNIPGLNVEGTAEGRPHWFRAAVGPELKYLGLDHIYLYPYLSVFFNRIWGAFEMEQTIQDLTGSEELTFRSRGDVNILMGVDYDISDDLRIKGEMSLFPNSDKVDVGVLFKVMIFF